MVLPLPSLDRQTEGQFHTSFLQQNQVPWAWLTKKFWWNVTASDANSKGSRNSERPPRPVAEWAGAGPWAGPWEEMRLQAECRFWGLRHQGRGIPKVVRSAASGPQPCPALYTALHLWCYHPSSFLRYPAPLRLTTGDCWAWELMFWVRHPGPQRQCNRKGTGSHWGMGDRASGESQAGGALYPEGDIVREALGWQ